MCSVAVLFTKNNASQVGSGFFNKPDNQEKTSSHVGVSKTSFVFFFFPAALAFVPTGVACVVGSLFHWLMLLLSTSWCVLLGLAVLWQGSLPWDLINMVKVHEHGLTVVVRGWFS